MKIEHHSWWSPNLGHDMALKVYGYYGKPLIAFPCQEGRYWDMEDRGMIAAIAPFIEAGQVKVFAVDSIDWQTWANWAAHPADRARRHQDYDRYLTDEVMPFVQQHNGGHFQKAIATGASMGTYHAANVFFRHPELFDTVIALSGLYRLNHFIGDYVDDNVYYNAPLLFLPNLNDAWYLDQYRASRIIVGVGQGAWEEEMLADAYALRDVLTQKGIPHWIDIWGQDVNHDWPWWLRMWPYFLGQLNLPRYTP